MRPYLSAACRVFIFPAGQTLTRASFNVRANVAGSTNELRHHLVRKVAQVRTLVLPRLRRDSRPVVEDLD